MSDLEGKILGTPEFLELGLRRTQHNFGGYNIFSKDKDKKLYLVEELGEKGFHIHYEISDGTIYDPKDDYVR